MEWLVGWKRRKKITITGSPGAGTNYQVLLKVGESSDTTGCDFNVEGHSTNFPSDKNQSGDLRFTSSDGTTPLSFWVEKVEGTSPNRTAYVWVKVADSLDSDVDIYCYYRNVNATNASNGDNTFLFFDDFEINEGTWTLFGQNSNKNYEISNNELHLPPVSNVAGLDEGVRASVEIGEHVAIETKMKINKAVAVGTSGIYLSKNDPPTGSGYLIFGATDNDKFGVSDWDFDESGVIEYNEFVAEYNNWHIWTVKKNGNTYTLVYDGENKGSITRTTTPKDYLVFGVPYNNNELWADWVFVRKYTDPEPTFSLASTEEKTILSGTACDKCGNPITDQAVEVFVLDKETGELLGQTTSDSNGNWSCEVGTAPGTKVVTVLTLEGEYGGDTDIAGAEFNITQEGS